MADPHSSAHDDGAVHVHIAPVSLYIKIFLGLIVLTVLTVGVSYVHLGPLNLAVAIIIATMKASLVVLFFMHLKDDAKFNALAFVGSLLFVGLFFVYTMNDTEHRGEIDWSNGGKVDPTTGQPAPGGPEAPEGKLAPGSVPHAKPQAH